MGWSLCPGKSKKKQNKKPNDSISSTSGTSMKEKKESKFQLHLSFYLSLILTLIYPVPYFFLKFVFLMYVCHWILAEIDGHLSFCLIVWIIVVICFGFSGECNFEKIVSADDCAIFFCGIVFKLICLQ